MNGSVMTQEERTTLKDDFIGGDVQLSKDTIEMLGGDSAENKANFISAQRRSWKI